MTRDPRIAEDWKVPGSLAKCRDGQAARVVRLVDNNWVQVRGKLTVMIERGDTYIRFKHDGSDFTCAIENRLQLEVLAE